MTELWPGGAAWIDGRYCPVEDAKISVLDLGVTRSDCTYDVIHVWHYQLARAAGRRRQPVDQPRDPHPASER
jgi:hypothetical protein